MSKEGSFMFMLAVPQFSSNQNEGTIQKLHQVILGQLEDLTTLCTIVEYLKGDLQTGLDRQEFQKYHHKMEAISNQQSDRYDEIDTLINNNVFQMKKGKTKDNTALIYGKEVRKLESGLRTLKLFASDVLLMFDNEKQLADRSDERLGYFEKRSTSLEAEMIMLNKELSLL